MTPWNDLIKTALLGTYRASLPTDLPAPWQPNLAQLPESDQETQFWQLCALAHNYTLVGQTPPVVVNPPTPAPPETLPPCTEQSRFLLETVLRHKVEPLIERWLQRCAARQQRAPAHLLPRLLELAQETPAWFGWIQRVAGERGPWLAAWRPEHYAPLGQSDEALWQTGRPAERKQAMKRWLDHDPAQARQAMQENWSGEKSEFRVDLLELLSPHLTPEDEPWLESLLDQDRSQKVREVVIHLLQRLPESQLNRQMTSLALSCCHFKKGGMLRKSTLDITWPDCFTPEQERYGLRTDQQRSTLVISTLISLIPPVAWEQITGLSPDKLVTWFQEHDLMQDHLNDLADAVHARRNVDWARAFLNHSQEQRFLPLLELLPVEERNTYLLSVVEQSDQNAIFTLINQYAHFPWSLALAEAVLSKMSGGYYNADPLKPFIPFLPLGILPKLPDLKPQRGYYARHWDTLQATLTDWLHLREDIDKSFQS
ncbi:hypothetical protein SAMN05421823_101185 [Catalinimonas alkaloidigena]|uniref:Uncharacterized protein n=1 Tax=Catalinimonas alkaloidigena TaxID=1075417 RepID=A0A1G8WTV7_9BACT|nr:DUF5691 domain-containing protein [Catalinimonas alkaloidigena]SDJ81809.1 hypothetical protein SAMN05421823_101185 [Catalinimonas alkaloidigena]